MALCIVLRLVSLNCVIASQCVRTLTRRTYVSLSPCKVGDSHIVVSSFLLNKSCCTLPLGLQQLAHSARFSCDLFFVFVLSFALVPARRPELSVSS
jgi:hypothetical protein